MRYFLEPADGWVFRENRAFGEAGENHAASLFPPSPAVLAGALRTAILYQHGVDLDRLRRGERALSGELEHFLGYAAGPGGAHVPGAFHIADVALGLAFESTNGAIAARVLRAAPADVVRESVKGENGSGETPCSTLEPIETEPHGMDWQGTPLRMPWARALRRPERARGYLGALDWAHYLRGSISKGLRLVPENRLFARDTRTGIGMNWESRTAASGQLYTTEYLVADDTPSAEGGSYVRPGLIVRCPGLERVLRPRVVRLGGEGRMARLLPLESTESEPDAAWEIEMSVAETRRFRLVVTTPAPLGEDDCALSLVSGGGVLARGPVHGRVVAMAGDPHGYVGGFDLIQGAPKPSLRIVPAGTVYWIELDEGSGTEVVDLFHGKSLHAEGSPRWAEGFGLTVVGGWNHVR